eukprot:160377-Rhodomonas_salina.1
MENPCMRRTMPEQFLQMNNCATIRRLHESSPYNHVFDPQSLHEQVTTVRDKELARLSSFVVDDVEVVIHYGMPLGVPLRSTGAWFDLNYDVSNAAVRVPVRRTQGGVVSQPENKGNALS